MCYLILYTYLLTLYFREILTHKNLLEPGGGEFINVSGFRNPPSIWLWSLFVRSNGNFMRVTVAFTTRWSEGNRIQSSFCHRLWNRTCCGHVNINLNPNLSLVYDCNDCPIFPTSIKRQLILSCRFFYMGKTVRLEKIYYKGENLKEQKFLTQVSFLLNTTHSDLQSYLRCL